MNRRKRATHADVDALTRQVNDLRAMLESLILLHERPDQLTSSTSALLANARKVLDATATWGRT